MVEGSALIRLLNGRKKQEKKIKGRGSEDV